MPVKKCFTAIALLAIAFNSFSQVRIKDISLQDALKQARSSDKIVMAVIESADCSQCNAVADQGLSNAVLGRTANDNCITLKINSHSADYALLDSLYNISNSFGLLFLDNEGNFLHRYNGSSSFYVTYMLELDKALKRKEHPDTDFQQLQKDYANGVRDFTTLYRLVAKKDSFLLEHDQLTDEMLNLAPKDSARSLTFLQFLAIQAPLIGSKADQYLRRDQQSFNDAWYLMPLQKRVGINNKINAKSKSKAIREKNIAYASRVAGFTSGTYTDKTAARKSYDRNMLDYFKGVRDTANYLRSAVRFYDQYLMNINADSVLRADSMRKAEAFKNAFSGATRVMVPGGAPVAANMVGFSPSTQYQANELNEGAWQIYTYTNDPSYLAKALAWAKRAVEFYASASVMDTYARLLYKTGDKDTAVSWEEKAVTLSQSNKTPGKEFEEVLARMKSGAVSLEK